MTLEYHIFRVRCRIDVSRQSLFAADLEVVTSELERLGGANSHPYGGTVNQALGSLCSRVGARSSMMAGFRWPFAYRITSYRAVMLNSQPADTGKYPRGSDDWAQYEDLKKYASTSWRSLAELTSGFLTNRYGLATWWSELDTSTSFEVYRNANRLGITNNRVNPRDPMVLRLDTTKLNLSSSWFRVPSILDGFNSVIFHAASDTSHPRTGIAIDLRSWGKFTLREIEVCATSVPIDAIQFRTPEVGTILPEQQMLDSDAEDFKKEMLSYYEVVEATL